MKSKRPSYFIMDSAPLQCILLLCVQQAERIWWLLLFCMVFLVIVNVMFECMHGGYTGGSNDTGLAQ